jgi:hypothetical protein
MKIRGQILHAQTIPLAPLASALLKSVPRLPWIDSPQTFARTLFRAPSPNFQTRCISTTQIQNFSTRRTTARGCLSNSRTLHSRRDSPAALYRSPAVLAKTSFPIVPQTPSAHRRRTSASRSHCFPAESCPSRNSHRLIDTARSPPGHPHRKLLAPCLRTGPSLRPAVHTGSLLHHSHMELQAGDAHRAPKHSIRETRHHGIRNR